MYPIRFLIILLLALLIRFLHFHQRFFVWLKPINHSPWEKSKTLIMPLMIQSLIEPCFHLESHYFPARLLLVIITLILFLFLMSVTHSNIFLEACIWLLSLVVGFFFEYQFLHDHHLLHPYDPYFAFLGLCLILLIFILNTYYPLDDLLFKKKR